MRPRPTPGLLSLTRGGLHQCRPEKRGPGERLVVPVSHYLVSARLKLRTTARSCAFKGTLLLADQAGATARPDSRTLIVIAFSPITTFSMTSRTTLARSALGRLTAAARRAIEHFAGLVAWVCRSCRSARLHRPDRRGRNDRAQRWRLPAQQASNIAGVVLCLCVPTTSTVDLFV
jgi:hypothetical protein